MTLRYKQPGKPKPGRRALANLRARTYVWPAVKRRSGLRCEMCLGREDLCWAHIVGRPATGLQLGEWANTVELTAALCQRCHDALDGRLQPVTLEDRHRILALLEAASDRLAKRGAGGFRPRPHPGQSQRQSWHDGIRLQIRQLEEQGIAPDKENR